MVRLLVRGEFQSVSNRGGRGGGGVKNSSIEWCDHTFNPWTGCAPVSDGCANCYAAAMWARFTSKGLAEFRGSGANRRAVFNGQVRRTSAAYWKQPIKWNAECRTPNTELKRPRVFCASMADWLHEAVPVEWLADLLDLIRRTPNLDWLLLTKRPENFVPLVHNVTMHRETTEAAAQCAYHWVHKKEPPSNVWIGTTVEDNSQRKRVEDLLRIPAAVRFLSCEPLLGAVDLTKWVKGSCDCGRIEHGRCHMDCPSQIKNGFHWVICGGESGPRARPMHPEWARGLRDQCVAAGVPFFFKQWGATIPFAQLGDNFDFGGMDWRRCKPDDRICVPKGAMPRTLDGREWNEFPVSGKSSGVGLQALEVRGGA